MLYELLNTFMYSIISISAVWIPFWPSPNLPLQSCLPQVQFRPRFFDPSSTFRLLIFNFFTSTIFSKACCHSMCRVLPSFPFEGWRKQASSAWLDCKSYLKTRACRPAWETLSRNCLYQRLSCGSARDFHAPWQLSVSLQILKCELMWVSWIRVHPA